MVILKSYNEFELLPEQQAMEGGDHAYMASTDHQTQYTYDVFLSFRGADTRFNFTDHLYTALSLRGIETFRDDDELRKGEQISPALLTAIEESRVSIIVFSQTYASSRWCLDELVKIMECRESKGQEVRPLFYKVDPSHVRHQIGGFGKAFATLDRGRYNNSRLEKWRKALKEAADLSGWTYNDGEYESQFIKDIVEELSNQVLNPSCLLDVAAHPVGLESCSQQVNRLLRMDENVVRMVGIWGPGGIGKTTIAKHVFNTIRHKFESSCFLADVRSKSSSNLDGLARLQETLLSDVLRDSSLKVPTVDKGLCFLKTKMRRKKVLLIFDDVSDSSQLQNLVPPLECFGKGSRILITTRDKYWLNLMNDGVYEVKMLDDPQSLELFCLNAFKRNEPPGDYLELAQRAVRYAQGLPLALNVLGSHLYYCKSKDEWEATLDNCREGDPHIKIRNILKISYDALGVELRNYFLDIACFFKDKNVDTVKPILAACYDFKPVTAGIAQLEQKALIRIDRTNNIWMHDLIEDMGKDIVYQESPDEAGKRSRLWCKDDVEHVLTNYTGTDNIIGIHFVSSKDIRLNAESFSGIKKLRYLYLEDCGLFSGQIEYLSKELRWLDWHDCSLQSFPSCFHANKLVKLNISCSRGMIRLWDGYKKFSGLTSMTLRGCESLRELPDFSGIANLKEFVLCDCKNLVEVPDSFGLLDKLVTLTVDSCSNLIRFPRKINLKSLETISIISCKLEEFSEFGEKMCSLRRLDLSRSFIKELHPSITKLMIGLKELELVSCYNLTTLPYNIYEWRNLQYVDARMCPKLFRFPVFLKKMDSLRRIHLGGSDMRELDESIGNLTGLEVLILSHCRNLGRLPSSIYGLQHLTSFYLVNCSKLVRFPTRNTKVLDVDACSLSLPKLKELYIGGCSSLSDCDFLTAVDCCQTLVELDLSRNNFVSLPACITKFVNLWELYLRDCQRLRQLPELPPKVKLDINGCESLERFPRLSNSGAVIEAVSSLIEPLEQHHIDWNASVAHDLQHVATQMSRLFLSSEPTKPSRLFLHLLVVFVFVLRTNITIHGSGGYGLSTWERLQTLAKFATC